MFACPRWIRYALPMPAREDTINTALGEVLQALRPTSWRVLAEEQRTLRGSAKRPDVLIEEPAGWPVVIEAERENHARAPRATRLSGSERIVESSNREIESAIALVYPPDVREQTGGKAQFRAALRETEGLEYALYTATSGDAVDRLPESGWLRGNVRDLAMLAHRASTPETRMSSGWGAFLSRAISSCVWRMSSPFGHRLIRAGQGIGRRACRRCSVKADDPAGQTRRMAMTVLVNALIFHSFACRKPGSMFERDPNASDPAASGRPLEQLSAFQTDLPASYRQFLLHRRMAAPFYDVNYWPIFATAREARLSNACP